MKNEDAKQILSAYRPSGDDASDPIFEEALKQARLDPELSAWFEEERRRDAELAHMFQAIPIPEHARSSLLALPRGKPTRKVRHFWRWTVAVAACFALLVGATLFRLPSLQPGTELALHNVRVLGTPELLELAHAVPLQFRGDSFPELRAWLTGRGAATPGPLPEALDALPAIGCRVLSDERGNAISLLCLKKDDQLVHLFVAEGKAREALVMAEKTWIQEDGWNAYCWADGVRTYVILSPAPREALQELVI